MRLEKRHLDALGVVAVLLVAAFAIAGICVGLGQRPGLIETINPEPPVREDQGVSDVWVYDRPAPETRPVLCYWEEDPKYPEPFVCQRVANSYYVGGDALTASILIRQYPPIAWIDPPVKR